MLHFDVVCELSARIEGSTKGTKGFFILPVFQGRFSCLMTMRAGALALFFIYSGLMRIPYFIVRNLATLGEIACSHYYCKYTGMGTRRKCWRSSRDVCSSRDVIETLKVQVLPRCKECRRGLTMRIVCLSLGLSVCQTCDL